MPTEAAFLQTARKASSSSESTLFANSVTVRTIKVACDNVNAEPRKIPHDVQAWMGVITAHFLL
jgi:hypothetical protein